MVQRPSVLRRATQVPSVFFHMCSVIQAGVSSGSGLFQRAWTATRVKIESSHPKNYDGIASSTLGLGSSSRFAVVQSLSCVQLSAMLRTAAHQASLSFSISQSLLILVSFESKMPSNHLILCHPLGSFPVSWLFGSSGQSIGASASASVLPMNIQCWFPLGLTDFISLLSKGISRVFSNTTVLQHHSLLQHHSSRAQFFSAKLKVQ